MFYKLCFIDLSQNILNILPFGSLFGKKNLECVKTFVCGKLPWSRKNVCLQKSLLRKFTEKKFLDCGKVPLLWQKS